MGGLSPEERARLLGRLTETRRGAVELPRPVPPLSRSGLDLRDTPDFAQIQAMRSAGQALGISNPYFRAHEGAAGAQTVIDGTAMINFSSYNYLGLSGHPRVAEAAKAAIDRYGTSVSASRLVAGERPLHGALEAALAELHGVEDCVAMVSGHATNVTVLGHLFGRDDLILHDALAHNSIIQGAQLAGARRLSFPHNDVDAAEAMLREARGKARRALVVIEAHYSMDGDVPDLARFSELARRHAAWLMVDEAHSVGVLGAKGRGLAEHAGLDGGAADLWMGTLSKALAGCGGYVAGRRDVIDYLRFSAPGFVYSVGMAPPLAAASLEALSILKEEPQRVEGLRENAGLFLAEARAAGLDTGLSEGFAIVPVITGSSITAARLSEALLKRGINVQPILHPAVPERSARLRFFLSSEHREGEIRAAVAATAEALSEVRGQGLDLGAVIAAVSGAR